MYNLVSDQVIKLYKDTEGYMWGRRLTEGRPYKIAAGYVQPHRNAVRL